MSSSTQNDFQPESFIDARSSGPYDAIDQQKQNLTENEDGAHQHIQPERFVNVYEEDESKYFLVLPFAVPPIWDPPKPQFLRFPYLPQGIPITRKELDIIKLTAQFAGVYGMYFWRDLMKRVSTNPQFDFLKSTDSMHLFYARLARGYSRVLMNSEILKFKGSSTAPVLDGFFKLLRKVEKQEEGLEMAMTDVHAFFVNMEEKVVRAPRELMNLPPKMEPPLGMMRLGIPNRMPGMSQKPKFDESALVPPEDQFIAKHPGPSTIRVSVPNVNNGQVIEIAMQSLSENVASLKEKIANKLILSGTDGVLEDNKSLAHYNVGAGEILTLTL